MIRLATRTDAADIVKIFRPFVEGTTITFASVCPTISELAQKIPDLDGTHPWLVCMIEDVVAGYAYAASYRAQAAYRWSVELTVYVDPAHHRMGVARKLYRAMLDLLKAQGFQHAYAVISLPNETSVAFHQSFGFRQFVTFKDAGFKLGSWHDVGWWELDLQDQIPQTPVEPLSIGQALKVVEINCS